MNSERDPRFYVDAWIADGTLKRDAAIWLDVYDEAYKSLKDVVKGKAGMPPPYITAMAQAYASHQASELLARAQRAVSV